MTSGLQLALAGGALSGLGLALLVWRLVPSSPDLADALDRLSPEYTQPHVTPGHAVTDGRERLGLWAMKTLPPGVWANTPTTDLAMLRVSKPRYYGEKVLYALTGLLIPPLLTGLLTVLGFSLPFVVPAAGSLALATVMFFLPTYNAHDDAKRARIEFNRALGAYIELVALERRSGSGSRQALELSAQIGDSWVFRRLDEELRRSRWSGQPPWEALHTLADELAVPELDDLADIMRLSGEEGAQIYTNLRARSAAMRSAMLNAELAKANAVAEQMYIPMSLLGVVFMAILVAPALLRVMGGTG